MASVYLMSIRPEYSSRIFAGTKTFELRRRPVRIAKGDVILVYETSPTQAVVGAFSVKGVRTSSSPKRIWRELLTSLGVSREAFDAYFEGAPGVWAIEVGHRRKFPPVSLVQVRESLDGFVPPQSYLKLAEDRLERLPPCIADAAAALVGAT